MWASLLPRFGGRGPGSGDGFARTSARTRSRARRDAHPRLQYRGMAFRPPCERPCPQRDPRKTRGGGGTGSGPDGGTAENSKPKSHARLLSGGVKARVQRHEKGSTCKRHALNCNVPGGRERHACRPMSSGRTVVCAISANHQTKWVECASRHSSSPGGWAGRLEVCLDSAPGRDSHALWILQTWRVF